MKTLWTLIKKELKRFFTDRRTLIAIFLPGIALFVIYSLMGNVIGDKAKEQLEVKEASICVKAEPEELKNFLKFEKITITYENDLSKDKAIEKIQNKELDLYVEFENNFYASSLAYDVSSGVSAPKVEIYYNSSKTESSAVAQEYIGKLQAYEATISNKFDINPNLTTQYDFATVEDTSKMILTMVVPFLLTIMLFSSSMGLCAESISGEKERGTIATLLATPTKRWQLALGKVIPLGIVCMCAGLVSSIGAIASLPNLVQGASDTETITLSVYGFNEYALLALMVTITAILFASILSIFSTYAKSVKEASSLCLIPMGITFMIGITGMFSSGAATAWWAYLIPIYNSVQCFTQIISLTINPLNYLLAVVSNIAYIGLAIFVTGKMFNNENIMFSK